MSGAVRNLSASCVVIQDQKVLLVKHTYGPAKGRYLIPGGFGEEGEMPRRTAEREVLEETGICVRAGELTAVRFTPGEVWCIFRGEYVEGMPVSDGQENDEAVWMPVEEALRSEDVVSTTKEILKSEWGAEKPALRKSAFVNERYDESSWQMFL